MKKAGVLLIVLAFIVGMMGCGAAPGQHALTISSSVGGEVVTPGEGTFTVDYGTVVELVAEADDNYYFVQWTGDVDTIANVGAASTTITIEGDYTITAEFGFDPQQVIEYELTISSTVGGSVIVPGEGVFSYEEEEVVNLVAEADDCYEFVGWTGDVEEIDDPLAAITNITMYDDYSVTANFELIEYELAISSTDGGSVTDPGEGIFTRGCGVVVNLVAEADDCYEFVGWTGDVESIDNPLSATTNITMYDDYSVTANFEFKVDPMIAAGGYHTVGLKSDGTVVAVGSNVSGQCDVGEWEGIIQVDAGEDHTVGVKSNGTVLAVGSNASGQCDVGDWADIVQVAAGWYHTVGLRADGTVVAVGLSDSGQCDVGSWEDIVQVAAGGYHTVGLRSDGTVVAAGLNTNGQRNVGDWQDIIQVAAGELHTVGVKDDGTVVAVGYNLLGQCNVGGWEDIVQVTAGALHTVGLKNDSSAVAVGLNTYGQCGVGDWADIVQVAAGALHTVGLMSDGSVVAAGLDDDGQCDVGAWALS
jgi:hypothetical protein